jgi:UDP-N-acetylmuramoyl-tripeptide--D-alanyl-D-alanine ligase
MELKSIYEKFLASTGITTDTRSIQNENIFFALKGENFNANLFAEEAFEKGAAYVVVDEITNKDWAERFGDKLVLVEDSLRALQQLAEYHRDHLKCPVLAITGSNGKTTTKELIAAVLTKKYKTYATKGNLNNHIGVPLTLLSMKQDAEFAIVEMGANHVGEIASYCEYTKPAYGLITNVGLAHTEGFGGFEGVVKGKTELYRYLAAKAGKVFVSQDNEILLKKVSDFGFAPDAVITYGKSSSAFCKGEPGSSGEFLSLVADGILIQTNLVGDYNFENVMSAVCVGKHFGVEMQPIKEAIESYVPSNNRSQKISYGSNAIILDAYNANPSSVMEALSNFKKLEAKNKTVILGEMMELGAISEAEHRKIAALLSGRDWSGVKKVFVGKGFSFLKDELSANGSHALKWFEKTKELKEWFARQKFEDEYILIKGSRKNALEKILKE